MEIRVYTLATEDDDPFRFDGTEHTYTAHADGDLTIDHHERGMVAVFARGQWAVVLTAEVAA